MRAGARKNEEKSPLGPQNAECFQIASAYLVDVSRLIAVIGHCH
jgi:hypothetical protein